MIYSRHVTSYHHLLSTPCFQQLQGMIPHNTHCLINVINKLKFKQFCLANYKTIASPQHWEQAYQQILLSIAQHNGTNANLLNTITQLLYSNLYSILNRIAPPEMLSTSANPTKSIKSLSVQHQILAKMISMTSHHTTIAASQFTSQPNNSTTSSLTFMTLSSAITIPCTKTTLPTLLKPAILRVNV